MLDTARPAAEVIEKNIPHNSPAQPGAPAQCLVHVGNADNAIGHEVIDLSCQCRLQAIGDVPRYLLAEPYGLFSQPCVERRRPLDGFFRGLGAAHDLDERNQVWRVEWMADDTTVGMQRAIQLDFTHGEAR